MALLQIINAIATFLTIETDILSNNHEVLDVSSNQTSKQLYYLVDYDSVSDDLKASYSSVDDFISKKKHEMNEIIISVDDRKHFADKFYEKHPDCRNYKSKIDACLNDYLDILEAELKKIISTEEKITYKRVIETLKTNQDKLKSAQKTQELTRELPLNGQDTKEKIYKPLDRTDKTTHEVNRPANDKSHSLAEISNIGILDFLSVRQLTRSLWVNWKTSHLSDDFLSAINSKNATDYFSSFIISPAQLRLLSVLVQGEGAVVSWKDLFWRGNLFPEWVNKYENYGQRQADSGDLLYLKDKCNPRPDEIKEISTRAINELQEVINDALKTFYKNRGFGELEKAEDIIQEADTKKGYRINLIKNDRRDLFYGYNGYTGKIAQDDFKRLKADIIDKRLPYCHEVSAWLRRYYSNTCKFFEDRVSNKGNDYINSSENEIFGDYKMVQAYMIPYVWTGKGNPDEVNETLLDFVERWHSEKKEFGRVLVLHGQPGDGKTTFCKKAVYAHCKEGWLPETPHIFQFSLNPSESEIIGEEGLNFANAFCFRDKGRRYTLDMDELEDTLEGSLIIFDGYDELADSLGNYKVLNTFNEFFERARLFAENNDCNVIITSRTMCIEADLKGIEFSSNEDASTALFAPLTVEQQKAMIDRMTELDELKKMDKNNSVFDSESYMTQEPEEMSLEFYRDRVLKYVWESRDEKLNDFKELLKVPILFRMIVSKRFSGFKNTDTIAELYGYLFYELLSHKNIGKIEEIEEELVSKYEEMAIRIFNYGDGTCPFSIRGDKADKKELVYYFYTTRDGKGTGYLGFLHNSFYQYFLARYIVSSIRKIGEYYLLEEKKLTEAQIHLDHKHLLKDFAKLFTSLRAVKLGDPDLWKLVTQLTRLEQNEKNHVSANKCLLYHSWENRIQKGHVKRILECLNKNDLYSNTMLLVDPFERKIDKKEEGENRNNYKEMENAVFNLLSACAAIENGYTESEEAQEKRVSSETALDKKRLSSKKERIAYGGKEGYPNICELLKRGDYSGIFLNGINFDDCDLEHAKLNGAHLIGSNMNRAKLTGAELSGANLERANLAYARIIGANLERAILKKSEMEGAELNRANLKSAILEEARLDLAHMDGVNLEYANLRKAYMKETCLFDAKIKRAKLDTAHLDGADLRQACLKEACLAGTYLRDAKLSGAHLEGACLEKAHLQGTELCSVYMKDTYLVGAEIDRATFDSMVGSDLRGAVFDVEQIEQAKKDGLKNLKARTESRNRSVVPTVLRTIPGLTKSINEGSRLKFGRYPQENKSEDGKFIPEPLIWRVLHVDRREGKALLITDKLIDCMPYNNVYEDVTWESSSLRKWMNSEFIRKAFTPEEASLIVKVWNQNYKNQIGAVLGGNATYDSAFALSTYEVSNNGDNVQSYFNGSYDRRAAVTYYAKEKGIYTSSNYKIGDRETGWWWLRSPGVLSDHATYVFTGGMVCDNGRNVSISYGSVRPALWIKL